MDSKKLMILMISIFLISTFLKMLETGAVMPKNSILDYSATQSVILGSWVDVGVCSILQAGSLFVIFKNLKFSFFRKAIVSISNVSYGMYLVNGILMFYIAPFFVSLPHSGIEICLTIIVMCIFVFILSWLLVLALSKIPVIGRYST